MFLLLSWAFLFCEATRMLAAGQFINKVKIPSMEELSLREVESTSHYHSSRRTRAVRYFQSSNFSATTVISSKHDLALAQWAGQPIPVSVVKLLNFELNLYPAFVCDCKRCR